MKNKGFTLVELMGVVTILSILALTTVPVVRDILNDAKTKGLEKQKNSIIESAKNWAASNTDLLPENGSILVQMETLKQEGFLENKIIKNPVTNKEMDACVLITYNEDYNQYEYEYNEECILPSSLRALATTSTKVTELPACVTDGNKCENGTPFAIQVNENEVYNFYVISDTKDDITLIMAGNIGSSVWISKLDYESSGGKSYSSYGNNEKGPITALNNLKDLTSTWTNIGEREYIVIDDTGKKDYSISILARARMLTYTEVTTLISENEGTMPKYLYQDSGEYWLSTAHSNATAGWYIYTYKGEILGNSSYATYNLRPVITLVKQPDLY